MRSGSILIFVLLAFVSTVAAQSLGELAKKEKERREKNREAGRKIHVVEQSDLAAGEVDDASDEPTAGVSSGSNLPQRAVSAPPRRAPGSGSSDREEYIEEEEDEEDEERAPSAIPLEADLQQRLRDFDLMKRDYDRQIQEIDAKIGANQKRIAEIEQSLSSVGAGGLPVAPQPDLGARYEGDFHGLMEEQGRLRQENESLEAQKQTLKRELIEKGRRGGIPASYLRF